jgi:heme-degrading monooxygenase HmoA
MRSLCLSAQAARVCRCIEKSAKTRVFSQLCWHSQSAQQHALGCSQANAAWSAGRAHNSREQDRLPLSHSKFVLNHGGTRARHDDCWLLPELVPSVTQQAETCVNVCVHGIATKASNAWYLAARARSAPRNHEHNYAARKKIVAFEKIMLQKMRE